MATKAIKKPKFSKQSLNTPRFSKPILIIFALIFATIGGYTIYRSFAFNGSIPGDNNNDGQVTLADLTTLLANWNTNNAATDFNNDGTVNTADLSILLSHYGDIGALIPSPITIPSVEPASQAQLGFNMQAAFTLDYALDAEKALGATIARWQPGWLSVENPTTGALYIGNYAEAALAHAAQIGIKPMAVCAYSPPSTSPFNLTIGAAGAKAGDYTIPINGSVASIDTSRDYLVGQGGYLISPVYNYYGTLIASVDTTNNTVTLASKLSFALPAGTVLTVNRLRYASPADSSPTNPSVVAFFRYCDYVASQIAANGATGWISIWNEPPWGHDHWHARGANYDSPPPGMNDDAGMKSFLQYALTINDLPPSVRIVNGAADRTGARGVAMQGLTLTTTSVSQNIDVDSMHAYGQSPEDYFWDTAQVNSAGNGWVQLNPGSQSDYDTMAYLDNSLHVGISIMATETGVPIADDTHHAIWLTRRVATAWGSGVTPIIYQFDTADGSTYGVYNSNTGAKRLAYYSLQRMMTLVGDLGGDGGSASSAPTFIGYSGGTWPPYATAIYGKNGTLLLVWQRTNLNNQDAPLTQPRPATYSAKFNLPAGSQVVSATDVVTGDSVPASISGNTLTLGAVGENVQAILIKP